MPSNHYVQIMEKAVHFCFHNSNVYLVVVMVNEVCKNQKVSYDTDAWRIGHRHMDKINVTELTIWKTRPDMFSQRYKGSINGDNWTKFECGHNKVKDEFTKKIIVRILEDEFDRSDDRQVNVVDIIVVDTITILSNPVVAMKHYALAKRRRANRTDEIDHIER